jgi:hypothetical protein
VDAVRSQFPHNIQLPSASGDIGITRIAVDPVSEQVSQDF